MHRAPVIVGACWPTHNRRLLSVITLMTSANSSNRNLRPRNAQHVPYQTCKRSTRFPCNQPIHNLARTAPTWAGRDYLNRNRGRFSQYTNSLIDTNDGDCCRGWRVFERLGLVDTCWITHYGIVVLRKLRSQSKNSALFGLVLSVAANNGTQIFFTFCSEYQL